jgi:undecaprenyl-diphosphatase
VVTATARWLLRGDLWVCLTLNRHAAEPVVRALQVASRLGDGPLWLACIPLLYVSHGAGAAQRLLGALLMAGVTYRLTKQATARSRPHVACPDVRLLAAPLDRYSFPSGHTLHAVAASMVLTSLGGPWPWIVWPFTLAIAASRVVLGLHYPSDVVAGACIGGWIGVLWSLDGNPLTQ